MVVEFVRAKEFRYCGGFGEEISFSEWFPINDVTEGQLNSKAEIMESLTGIYTWIEYR